MNYEQNFYVNVQMAVSVKEFRSELECWDIDGHNYKAGVFPLRSPEVEIIITVKPFMATRD